MFSRQQLDCYSRINYALNKLNLPSLEVYENQKKKEKEKQERDDVGEQNDEQTGSKYAFSEKKTDWVTCKNNASIC